MRGFTKSDFPDYETFLKHRSNLERAQGAADKLFRIRDEVCRFTRHNPGMYWEFQQIIDDAVQIGYESGIGKPHRTSDYDITSKTLTSKNKCKLCDHGYLVYNCEQECTRKDKGLDCELKVREYFE